MAQNKPSLRLQPRSPSWWRPSWGESAKVPVSKDASSESRMQDARVGKPQHAQLNGLRFGRGLSTLKIGVGAKRFIQRSRL